MASPDRTPGPPPPPLDRPALLAALRARVERLERPGAGRRDGAAVPVCDGLPLPGGGLSRAGVHEVLAADPGAAVGFCALLLGRTGGTVLWIAHDGGGGPPDAWPPGLARFGLPPERLVLAGAGRAADALWAMEEALRCPAVAGALLALGRENNGSGAGNVALDLTAMRRLQLAAEAGGAVGLLLLPDAAEPAPTAALTRWRVSALPGTGMAAHDLGDPRWRLDLLRCRGGGRPGGPWRVVWRAAAGALELDGFGTGATAGDSAGEAAFGAGRR